MPYIKKDHRAPAARNPQDAGELNYAITSLCIEYMQRLGERYVNYNDVIGALESCKLEFYARAVRPYEDTKIEENGDVY